LHNRSERGADRLAIPTCPLTFRTPNAVSAKRTLLVAEDNLDEIFLIRRALAKTDLPWQLRFVPNGQEMIDYLQRRPPYDNNDIYPPPAALVIDIGMPQVNGFEVLTWIQGHPALDRPPAVIHTSSLAETDREEAIRLGAAGYYIKCCPPTEIPKMLQRIADDCAKRDEESH